MKHLCGIYPLPNPPPEMGRGLAPSPLQGEGWGEGNERLLILVGLTGTGKTTTVNALRDQECDFFLLPNRRDLTDQLIIGYLQQLDGEPVVAVTDRTERFTYTRRYREMYPGGMAEAVGQWLMVNNQLLIVNGASSTDNGSRIPDCGLGAFHLLKNTAVKTAPTFTKSAFADSFPVHEGGLCKRCREFIRRIKTFETHSYDLRIFDGLRGENEIVYAAKNMPTAWFLFLDAPDFVRVQRLLRRNDLFDQTSVFDGDGETAVSLNPTLTNWLNEQQIAQLEHAIRSGELRAEDVHAKLTIVQKERQNYDPDATLAALRQHAPYRLIYADTAAHSPEEIAQQVINELPT